MIRIGRSAGIRFSFSESQRLWNPLSTEKVMLFENGLPHSGSLWNFCTSSASLVCHSEPVGCATFAMNGALRPINIWPKNGLGESASGPVARV